MNREIDATPIVIGLMILKELLLIKQIKEKDSQNFRLEANKQLKLCMTEQKDY